MEPNSTKRPKRWIKLLFVASLAMNLLVIGAVGSAIAFGDRWKHHHKHHGSAWGGGGPLTRALSDEDRRVVGKELRRAGKANPERRAMYRQVVRDLIAELRADPFDAEAVAEHLNQIMDLGRHRLGVAKGILAEHLAQMPAEDRAAYADRLEEGLERYRRK